MAKTIYFNTGRKYTPAGQEITATLHEDGVVTFFDHSRKIDGEFSTFEELFGKADVMAAYDSGKYQNTLRSWEDGMMRGGCNSEYKGG